MHRISSETFRELLFLTVLAAIAVLPGLGTLPPIDRDESRYVQATVQMVETGELIDIRFQDDARHKKPAGAYWAQLASLTVTGQIDNVKRGERAIWVHRLPSFIGALIAIWATYLCGLAIFGRRDAFLGAGLLAVSIALVFEAHIAKTDALLAGMSAVMLYGLMVGKSWPSWLGLAFATLIKGPILIGVAGLALTVEAIWSRSTTRLRAVLKPLPILVACLIAVPWFVAIGLKTDGAFFAEALGRDFGGKIAGVQETHGGPPGYYVLSGLLTLWPGLIAVPLAGLYGWRHRNDRSVRFLIAWLVPMWIILECVPTKLPHYTLPLIPALFLLAGAGWTRLIDTPRLRWIGFGVAVIMALLLSLGVAATLWEILSPVQVSLIALGLIALSISACFCFFKHEIRRGLAFSALFLGIGFGGVLGQTPLLDLSQRVVAMVPTGAQIISPDYREPSLVFLAGTQTRLTREVEPSDYLILGHYSDAPACATRIDSVSGMNYAKGDPLLLTAYSTQKCSADALIQWAKSNSEDSAAAAH